MTKKGPVQPGFFFAPRAEAVKSQAAKFFRASGSEQANRSGFNPLQTSRGERGGIRPLDSPCLQYGANKQGRPHACRSRIVRALNHKFRNTLRDAAPMVAPKAGRKSDATAPYSLREGDLACRFFSSDERDRRPPHQLSAERIKEATPCRYPASISQGVRRRIVFLPVWPESKSGVQGVCRPVV